MAGGLRAAQSLDRRKGGAMRWIYLAVIILFVAAIIIFAVQNFEIVTMSFLGFNARVPLALLGAGGLLLGAVTGRKLYALVRWTDEEVRRGFGAALAGCRFLPEPTRLTMDETARE